MKTYHIKDLLKKELLILELPRVCDYKLTKEMIFIMDKERSTIHRFKGSYTLLGKPDEIKEEDAMELVEKVMNGQHFQNYKGRKENDFANLWCKNATESLLSAIETEILWDVNPLDKPDDVIGLGSPFDGLIKNEMQRHREAELRTFDKKRTLIFVKN